MTAIHRSSGLMRNGQSERELLSCCYCGAPLEAIMLNTDDVTGEQRLLWACRNMKKKMCFFPMGLPNEVFYLTRTAAEKRKGYIPKPNIQLLPTKYRGLYPSVFGNPTSNGSSRCGTPVSTRATTDACSVSTYAHSPSTSRSSVSSANAAADQQLLQSLSNRDSGASACDDPPNTSAHAEYGTGNDESASSEMNSCSTNSSTEAVGARADEAFTDFICDQLHEMNVDISELEDEELIKKMAHIVKQLEKDRRRGRNHLRHISVSEYRVSADYLYNLDVAPIKRKLNVLSTDLTRAVEVMRSGCDVETMLNAIGGSLSIPAPPVKRPRKNNSRKEMKRRIDAVLKKLASSTYGIREEVDVISSGTSTNDDTTGAGWYEGEVGPSTSVETSIDHTAVASNALTSSDMEERLNAIVQNRIRSQVANSAARRSAYQQGEMQRPTQQALHPAYPAVSLSTHVEQNISNQSNNENDGLSFGSTSLISGEVSPHESISSYSQSHRCEEHLVTHETEAYHPLHSDSQNSVDINYGLFDEYDLFS